MAKKKKLYGLEVNINDVLCVPLISLSKADYYKKLNEVAGEYNNKSIDETYDEHHFFNEEKTVISNEFYKVTQLHICVDMCDLYFYEAECREGCAFKVSLEKLLNSCAV